MEKQVRERRRAGRFFFFYRDHEAIFVFFEWKFVQKIEEILTHLSFRAKHTKIEDPVNDIEVEHGTFVCFAFSASFPRTARFGNR